MSFQKFNAPLLFTGNALLDDSHVLITDSTGRVEAIVPLAEAGEDVQHLEGILSPGFINCHCHLELSHMKGLIPEKTGLVDFIFKVVTERQLPDEAISEAIARGEEEMLQNGIVAVGDICNNASTLPQKLKNRLLYYNFIELSGWIPAVAAARFEKGLEVLDAFKNSSGPVHPTTLVPHAPYSVSDPLWDMLQAHFESHTISIHNQETIFEDDLFLDGTGDFTRMYQMMNMDTSFFHPTGKSSLQSYFRRLSNAKQALLVHNSFTREDDLLFVKQFATTAYWCICINANQYIENAVPPIDMLRNHQCNLVIGTDSLASNHSLSILDELKTIAHHFPHIPLQELLTWATSNGAKALQLDTTLGSFEQGKKPGVILIEQSTNEQIVNQSAKVNRLI